MKKLKLDLDRIQVVSFSVETKGGDGTVKGFDRPDTDIGCGGGGQTNGGSSCRICDPVPESYGDGATCYVC